MKAYGGTNLLTALLLLLHGSRTNLLEGGVPNGIRTRVAAVRGQCPRPLDDGDEKMYMTITMDSFKNQGLWFNCMSFILRQKNLRIEADNESTFCRKFFWINYSASGVFV